METIASVQSEKQTKVDVYNNEQQTLSEPSEYDIKRQKIQHNTERFNSRGIQFVKTWQEYRKTERDVETPQIH